MSQLTSSYVDWDRARQVGTRLAGTGPAIGAAEARQAVAELRAAAHRAYEPVAETARLDTSGAVDSPVYVVDRAGWIAVNTASFEQMMAPVIDKLTAKRAAGPWVRKVSGTVAGSEVGTLLGWVSGKVLGQFDLAPGGTPSLLLVAPNIVAAERELDVDPHDFRLWVCLHEETHRVQFTAVPWLRDHMVARSRDLLVDLVPDPDALQQRLRQAVRTLPEAHWLRRVAFAVLARGVGVAAWAALLIAAFVQTPWVPRETIETTDGTVTGYVLSVDSGFLNVLTDEHTVIILNTSDVRARR